MAATVLVIDNDSAIRESLVTFLQNHAFTAMSAADADIVALLRENRTDAVICDLALALQADIDWLARIAAAFPQLPVIVMSAGGLTDDVLNALRCGAADYLVKPLKDPEVLLHTLRRVLERSRLEAENLAYREYLEKTNTELRRNLEELRNDQLAGRQAQLRMLPEPLQIDGIECRHHLIPSLLLSGDFLDYFELPDQRVVFYLADVSGHGASSAFVTVLLKNLTYRLRRNLKRGSSDDLLYPDLVLARINSELMASELDKHLTMFYGVIDIRTMKLQYSVGGHFPMPVLLQEGRAAYLDGRGMPVGLFREAKYQTYECQLADQFQLLLFSDGILEIIQEPSLNEKEARLLRVVQDTHGDLGQIARLFGLDELPEVPDDIAMMAIGRGRA